MFVVLFIGVVASGCTQNLRPYRLWENNQFRDVVVPTKDKIKSGGGGKGTYAYPIDKVWQACLGLAVQGAGVLGVKTDLGKSYQLLFVASVAQERNLKYLDKVAGQMAFDFIEAWVAVDIEKINDNETEVSVAWVSPDGKVKNALEAGYEIPEKEMALAGIARTAMTTYLEAVKSQLEDSRWERLYSPALPQRPLRAGPAAEKVDNPPWAEYSIPYGNYLSMTTKTQYYCIENSKLTRHMEDIAHLILTAAHVQDEKIAAYILYSNKSNAFVSPNGDIFITTAQLDSLANSDELAGILAHELDHVIQKDGITRLKSQYETTNLKFNIIASTMVVAFAGSLVHNLDFWLGKDGTRNYAASSLGVAAIFGGAAVGLIASAETGEILDRHYSIEQEFRADKNATIYLWRAGFDHTAWLKVLKKMQTEGVSKLLSKAE